MPTIQDLNALDRAAFGAVIGRVFEHSPWVADETWLRRPFHDVGDLQARLCTTMRAAGRERQLALINAHPDLAGRLARQQKLTAESAREQASAGLSTLTTAEFAEFQRLNAQYRDKFGFPFVICARLNDKATIVAAMRTRLANTREQEFQRALAEIEKIVRLRLDEVLRA